jgi:hypothetical protein
MPVIPAIRMLRQKNQEVEASLDYIARSCCKKQINQKKKKKSKQSNSMMIFLVVALFCFFCSTGV